MTENKKEMLNNSSNPAQEKEKKKKKITAIKVLFAMEYVLQGLANPFQGITYQPFFTHFRYDYGLSEAATQQMFSRAYLAWSFKPIIGFFMDAFGKTKVALLFLLALGTIFYALMPVFDVSISMFFGMMFLLSVFFACTDVAVDRATVIEGDAESKSSGKSKATTVGLNQAICWAAIYGTNIISAVCGGWIAEHLSIKVLFIFLAIVPLAVILVVLRLPKDKNVSIPLRESISNFWVGLNTGPILWVMLFYFLFHFQPQLGALWTNHLIENLHFTQTQIGYVDGLGGYVGYFVGVLFFVWLGIKWQDKYGLKSLFKTFIIISILLNLTQYVLIDPYFTRVTDIIYRILPRDLKSEYKINEGVINKLKPMYSLNENSFKSLIDKIDKESLNKIKPLLDNEFQGEKFNERLKNLGFSKQNIETVQKHLVIRDIIPKDKFQLIDNSIKGKAFAKNEFILALKGLNLKEEDLQIVLTSANPKENVRMVYLSVYNFVFYFIYGLVRMSTFSLVGAVIPINAAGALFAGFMSVANFAYSFSYSSGAWIYENALDYPVIKSFTNFMFGNKGIPEGQIKIALLIFIGSIAFLLSFISAHMLPGKKQTLAVEDDKNYMIGPEQFKVLGNKLLNNIKIISILLFVILFILLTYFFGSTAFQFKQKPQVVNNLKNELAYEKLVDIENMFKNKDYPKSKWIKNLNNIEWVKIDERDLIIFANIANLEKQNQIKKEYFNKYITKNNLIKGLKKLGIEEKNVEIPITKLEKFNLTNKEKESILNQTEFSKIEGFTILSAFIKGLILAFFLTAFFRRLFLDFRYKKICAPGRN